MPNLILLNAPGPQGGKGPKGDKGDPGPAGPAGSALAVSGTGFVHWSGTGADAFARAVNLASSGTAGDVTGFLPVANIAPSGVNGKVLVTRAGAATWDVLSIQDFTPGTSGQILATIGTTATWTSLVSIETTHGRFSAGGSGFDYKATIGPYVGSETTNGAVYLLPWNVAPNGANPCLFTDASNTFLNIPGGSGIIGFIAAGSTYLGAFSGSVSRFFVGGSYIAGGAPLIVDWATANQTQLFAGTSATSFLIASTAPLVSTIKIAINGALVADLVPGDITLAPQLAYASASSNKAGGNVVVETHALSGGILAGPFLRISYAQGGGTVYPFTVGNYGNGSYGAIWFMTASPGGSNWSFLSDGTSTYFNAPSAAGHMYFGLGTTYVVDVSNTNWKLGALYSSPQFVWDLSNTAIQHFTTNATSAKIMYDAVTSDVATAALTIQGQYAFATATGTNRIPGYMVFDVGAPTNGLTGVTSEAEFQWSRAGTVLQTFKFDNVNDIALWRLPNTLWEWEWVVGNGEIILANNLYATGGGSAWWISAQTSTVFFGGFVTAASPIIVDFTTSTTPTIRGGSAAVSVTVGSNKTGASLLLQGDAATTILTLTTLAELATSLIMDPVGAPSAPGANKVTVYVDNSDGGLYAIDANSNIYQLAI